MRAICRWKDSMLGVATGILVSVGATVRPQSTFSRINISIVGGQSSQGDANCDGQIDAQETHGHSLST